jgi:hypothetical protein
MKWLAKNKEESLEVVAAMDDLGGKWKMMKKEKIN